MTNPARMTIEESAAFMQMTVDQYLQWVRNYAMDDIEYLPSDPANQEVK
jgi:hypothetical protein